MVIGFTERSRTVSESLAVDSSYFLGIDIATLRVSEMGHRIIIRHNEQLSTAVVESILGQTTLSDVSFGARRLSGGPLEIFSELNPGQATLRRVFAVIIQDFLIEPEECFTLQLHFSETPGARVPLVTCNADDSSTNFFCEHTVCIEDDDGMYFLLSHVIIINMHRYRTIYDWICANNIHCSGEC